VAFESETDRVYLAAGEWEELLAAAVELDLVRGGYYRAREGVILCYCGPDDPPEGWTHGFAGGSPDLPRALVGQAEVEPGAAPNRTAVRLEVANWAAARAVPRAEGSGFPQYVLAQEQALRGTEAERRWLRRAFDRLRHHARGSLLPGS